MSNVTFLGVKPGRFATSAGERRQEGRVWSGPLYAGAALQRCVHEWGGAGVAWRDVA